jgi:hypothetical protein
MANDHPRGKWALVTDAMKSDHKSDVVACRIHQYAVAEASDGVNELIGIIRVRSNNPFEFGTIPRIGDGTCSVLRIRRLAPAELHGRVVSMPITMSASRSVRWPVNCCLPALRARRLVPDRQRHA